MALGAVQCTNLGGEIHFLGIGHPAPRTSCNEREGGEGGGGGGGRRLCETALGLSEALVFGLVMRHGQFMGSNA